ASPMPRQRNRNTQSTSSTKTILLLSLALLALTWLVFGRTLHNGFINYDDGDYVTQNAQVKNGLTADGVAWAFTHLHAGNWHPLTWLSHMLDCQMFGLHPAGHHFTNVLLHSTAAVLLFLVLLQMINGAGRMMPIWRCAFVAALFAVHPLRTESVAWI